MNMEECLENGTIIQADKYTKPYQVESINKLICSLDGTVGILEISVMKIYELRDQYLYTPDNSKMIKENSKNDSPEDIGKMLVADLNVIRINDGPYAPPKHIHYVLEACLNKDFELHMRKQRHSFCALLKLYFDLPRSSAMKACHRFLCEGKICAR